MTNIEKLAIAGAVASILGFAIGCASLAITLALVL